MAKTDKLLTKLKKKPPPTDFTWQQLTTLLCSYGCEVIKGSGSRRKFFHPASKRILSLHEPHPDPVLKRYMIDDALEFIENIKP